MISVSEGPRFRTSTARGMVASGVYIHITKSTKKLPLHQIGPERDVSFGNVRAAPRALPRLVELRDVLVVLLHGVHEVLALLLLRLLVILEPRWHTC